MLRARPKVIQDFVEAQTIVVPSFHHYLSKTSNGRIVINSNPSISQPLIIEEENSTLDCLTVEKFIELCVNLWEQEHNYQEDILQLKDSICEEFNKFCANCENKLFINFIRKQRSKVIYFQLLFLLLTSIKFIFISFHKILK